MITLVPQAIPLATAPFRYLPINSGLLISNNI